MSDEDVRAGLRALTRRMVEGAPYEEARTMLDALARLPGADPTEIAGRRLALLGVYHQSSRERERVLRAVLPELAPLSPRERAQWVLGACVDHRALAERYLPGVIADLEAAGDGEEAKLLHDRLDQARARVRSTRKRRSEATSEEQGFAFPPHLKAGLEVVRWLTVGRRTYQEITEALDAIMELPGSDLAAPRVAMERLIALYLHERDDAEVERVLGEIAPALGSLGVREQAIAVARVCSGRPDLAERYLPPLIDQLEETLRQRPDPIGEQALATVRRTLERTRAAAASK